MHAERAPCRLCGSGRTRSLGAIAASDYFAGRVLERPLGGTRLWECADCGSMFRHPILTAQQYLELYAVGAADQWGGSQSREDLRTIRSIVSSAAIRTALDVGCGTGDFLGSLPDSIAKYGIEPSPAAVQAAKRGVSIVSADLEHCAADTLFDAVTIIDVIEHVPDPEAFLRQAYAHVSPGGLLIVSTGDPETFLWRRCLRARFWYVSFPEHISFPAKTFFARWCQRTGAVLAARRRVRYQKLTAMHRLAGWAMQFVYGASPAAFSLAGRLLLRRGHTCGSQPRRLFSPGVPGAFVDHQIVVLRKPTLGADTAGSGAEEKIGLDGTHGLTAGQVGNAHQREASRQQPGHDIGR